MKLHPPPSEWADFNHSKSSQERIMKKLLKAVAGGFWLSFSLSLLAPLLPSATQAEMGVEGWVQRYNGVGNGLDQGRSVAVDGSGNVFVTGSSWNGVSSDYITIAYSGEGVPLWTKSYDGPASHDQAIALVTDG